MNSKAVVPRAAAAEPLRILVLAAGVIGSVYRLGQELRAAARRSGLLVPAFDALLSPRATGRAAL